MKRSFVYCSHRVSRQAKRTWQILKRTVEEEEEEVLS